MGLIGLVGMERTGALAVARTAAGRAAVVGVVALAVGRAVAAGAVAFAAAAVG